MNKWQEIARDYNVSDEDVQDAHISAVEGVYELHKITCDLHVWEDGFEQGSASDDEMKALAKRLHHSSVDELLETLDNDLENFFRFHLEKEHENNERLDDEKDGLPFYQ